VIAPPHHHDPLLAELAAAGGTAAPASATARLRTLLADALRTGRAELAKPRSGYEHPVTVAMAATPEHLLAATPAPAALRADPDAAPDRTWLLLAAVVGALAELVELPAPARPADLVVTTAELDDGSLGLALPTPRPLAPETLDELVPLALAEHAEGLDRLRAVAHAVPAPVLGEPALRDPIGAAHPLRIAEAVARLGGRPAQARSVQALEEAVLALVDSDEGGAHRPHEDPDPARRVARRILQRLNGMGKWGGYHTEFAHLARGFAGNDRELAVAVGDALLAAGLLAEKPSVGQRHVFLNPRRAADVHRLIERGDLPAGLRLPLS